MNVQSNVRIPSLRLSNFTKRITRNSRKNTATFNYVLMKRERGKGKQKQKFVLFADASIHLYSDLSCLLFLTFSAFDPDFEFSSFIRCLLHCVLFAHISSTSSIMVSIKLPNTTIKSNTFQASPK